MKEEDMLDEDMVPLIKLAEGYADVAESKAMSTRDGKEEGRAKWLQERRKGIGGSDVGPIMGVDQYRTPLDVYHEKVDGRQQDENPHTRRGRALEALVADEYLLRHPEDTLSEPHGILVHPDHDWMLANPDRIITSPRFSGKGILEIKTPARANYERIKLKGVPLSYALQMQHYLMVTGYKWGTFAIFNADAWELTLIPVERWASDTLDHMVSICQAFWEDYVVPQIPPPMLPRERVELPKVEGRLKDMTEDDEFAVAVDAYMSASEYAKEAEALKSAARDAVLDAIRQEQGVFENENWRVYNTPVAGRKTLDKKALANAKPIDRTSLALYLAENDSEPFAADMYDAIKQGTFDLDVGAFEKQGNDFTTMRVYPVKPEG